MSDVFAPPAGPSASPGVGGATTYPDTTMGAVARTVDAARGNLLAVLMLPVVVLAPLNLVFGAVDVLVADEELYNLISRAESVARSLLTLWVQIAVLLGMRDGEQGRVSGLGALLGEAVEHFAAVLVQRIVVVLLSVVALLLFILPGVYLALMWWLLYPVVIFEDRGGEARARSAELVRPRWPQVIGAILVGQAPLVGLVAAAVVVLFAVFYVGVPPGPFVEQLDSPLWLVLARLVNLVLQPLAFVPTMLMYGVYRNAVAAEGGGPPADRRAGRGDE